MRVYRFFCFDKCHLQGNVVSQKVSFMTNGVRKKEWLREKLSVNYKNRPCTYKSISALHLPLHKYQTLHDTVQSPYNHIQYCDENIKHPPIQTKFAALWCTFSVHLHVSKELVTKNHTFPRRNKKNIFFFTTPLKTISLTQEPNAVRYQLSSNCQKFTNLIMQKIMLRWMHFFLINWCKPEIKLIMNKTLYFITVPGLTTGGLAAGVGEVGAADWAEPFFPLFQGLVLGSGAST